MHIGFTQRGFARADFTDLNNDRCSIQDSSAPRGIHDDAIWLGCDQGTHVDGQRLARMHLTRAMAAELIPILQRFVETGSIAPNADPPGA